MDVEPNYSIIISSPRHQLQTSDTPSAKADESECAFADSSASDEAETLRMTVSQLNESLAETKEKVAAVEEEKGGLEAEIRDLKLTLDEKDTRLLLIKNKADDHDRVTQLLAESEERERALEEGMRLMQVGKAEAEKLVMHCESKIDGMKASEEALVSKDAEVQLLKSYQVELEKKIEEMNVKASKEETELRERFQEKVKELQTEMGVTEGLRGSLSAKESQLSVAEGDLNVTRASLAQLEKDKERLEAALGALREEAADREQSISRLTGDKEREIEKSLAFSHEIEQLRAARLNLETELDKATKNLAQADDLKNDLMRDIEAKSRELDGLRIEHELAIEESQATIDQLKKDLSKYSPADSNDERLKRCKVEIASLENEKSRLEERLRDEKGKHEEQVNRLEEEMKSFKTSAEVMSNEYHALLVDKAEAVKSMSEREQEIETLRLSLQAEKKAYVEVTQTHEELQRK